MSMNYEWRTTLRVCKCGVSFYPYRPRQKNCIKCIPKFISKNTTICIGCGRHSHSLVDKKCSFCREKEVKMRAQVKSAIHNSHGTRYQKIFEKEMIE